MKKTVILCLLPIFFFIILLGCRKHVPENESPAVPLFDKYKKIYVDWLDLKEEDWKVHGYESVEQWREVILEMNMDAFHRFLKELIPGKEFSFSTSISGEPGKDMELHIKFSDCNIIYHAPRPFRGRWIEVPVNIHYIDLKTNKEIYTESITPIGSNRLIPNFEILLKSAMHTIAEYIAERFSE